MDVASTPDYIGYLDDLRWALGLPQIQQALQQSRPLSLNDYVRHWQTSRADAEILENTTETYWLVSTLGFCRLFDVELPNDLASAVQRPLPVEIVVPAMRGLIRALEHLKQDAHELPERFDDAEPVEDVALCTSILHQLMQTWAAFIAINEDYKEYLNAGGSPSGEFGRLMREILDAYERADEVVQSVEQMQLLSIATQLPLLENWRKMLRGPFKEMVPWWLDGTLEHIAVEQSGACQVAVVSRGRSTTDAGYCDADCRPQATVFLSEWAKELAANGSGFSIAASVPIQHFDERFSVRRSILGDESVRVRFAVGSPRENVHELSIFLVGDPVSTARYRLVEIDLGEQRPLAADITGDAASFYLTQDAIEKIVRIGLVAADGQRRQVDLQSAIVQHGNESAIDAQQPA